MQSSMQIRIVARLQLEQSISTGSSRSLLDLTGLNRKVRSIFEELDQVLGLF